MKNLEGIRYQISDSEEIKYPELVLDCISIRKCWRWR